MMRLAAKLLSAVEVSEDASHQHEFHAGELRKALAFPDDRYRGTAGDAKLAIERHQKVPFAENLAGTDIWAWHRPFRGQLRTLIDKDGRTNALWDGLAGFRRQLPVNKPGTTGGRTPQPQAASAARA